MPALSQAREALMALRTLAVDAPATASRGVNRWPDVLALVDAAQDALTRVETAPTPAPPELAVLHVRDPDGYCDVRLFADGTALDVDLYGVESVDAGAGHDAEEWADRIAAAEADPPSDYRNAVVAALNNPPGRRGHITGWDEIDAHLEEARARRDRANQQAHR